MAKMLFFIYNPHAGTQKIRVKLAEIVELFADAGYRITVHPTQTRGEAFSVIEKLDAGYSLVVCSGGDGTLAEVAGGMLRRDRSERIPIGYIPSGSTNDFGMSLKIPNDMLEAAKVPLTGRELFCDMGRFNRRSFVYVAAFGMFTDISYETDSELKHTFGHLAYILEAILRFPQVKACHMTVDHDGVILEDDFLFGMVSNSLSVGGIKSVTGPDVLLDDGLFEVTLVRSPQNPQDLHNKALATIGGEESNSFIINFKTDRIRFCSDRPVPWTLDGEYGGKPKKAELMNLRGALRIMVPMDVELPCIDDKEEKTELQEGDRLALEAEAYADLAERVGI